MNFFYFFLLLSTQNKFWLLHQLVFPMLLLKWAVEKDLYEVWLMATNSQIFCFQLLWSWSLMGGRQLSLFTEVGGVMQVSMPVTSVGGWLCIYQLWEKHAALRHSCNLAGLCPWCSLQLPRLCLFCVTFGAGQRLRMCPQVAIELQWAVSLCQQASGLGVSRGCQASSAC